MASSPRKARKSRRTKWKATSRRNAATRIERIKVSGSPFRAVRIPTPSPFVVKGLELEIEEWRRFGAVDHEERENEQPGKSPGGDRAPLVIEFEAVGKEMGNPPGNQ